MASRLDRLFILLETGTNAATKKAAAQQLGEAQRLHPHELHHLLARVSTLLKSPQWDTRVSAANAVQAILAQVPPWAPEPLKEESSENNTSELKTIGRNNRLNLENFDMSQVLARSSHLTGSEGTEYDLVIAEGENNPTVQQGEKLLAAKLGLHPRIMGVDTKDLFTAEDLALPTASTTLQTSTIKVSIDETLREQQTSSGLSRREMNRAKRKARQSLSKQRSRDIDESQESGTNSRSNNYSQSINNTTAEGLRKKMKFEESALTSSDGTSKTIGISSNEGVNGNFTGSVPDPTGSWPDTAINWPLDSYAETLCQDLFSQKWEVRHGAATALRELIRLHGKGAGKSKNQTEIQMHESHRRWIMDAALRLLCVLGLDRFGDFVSDQVVAPVRETCAQALGSLVMLMQNGDNKIIMGIIDVTLKLLQHNEWEARHGAFLALKYLLAVRDDISDELLPRIFPAAMRGLADQVDDVGAAAASALIPVAAVLPRVLDPPQLQTIVARLWELLREQDDLAAACNSFMGLLAAIISLPAARACLPPQPLSQVLPRLWPFLNHSSSSVRKATLQTLQTLTGEDGDLTNDDRRERWCDDGAAVLQEALRHVFQRVLIEHVATIQEIAERVWENLVVRSDLEMLLHAACPMVGTWLCLAMQPENVPFNPTLLYNGCVLPPSTPVKLPKPPNETNGDVQTDCVAANSSCNAKSPSELKIYIGGIETVAQNTRVANTTRARCMASRVLGLLSRYVVHPVPGLPPTPEIPSPAVCYARVLLAHLASRSALQRTVVGLTMIHWATLEHPNPPDIPDILRDKLLGCLNECVYYDEIAGAFTRLLHETRDYIATLKHYKFALPVDEDTTTIMTLEQISAVAAKSIGELQLSRPPSTGLSGTANNALPKIKPKLIQSLDERRRALENGAASTAAQQQAWNVMSMAALAGAATMLRCLPEAPRPLNPLIKPLMEAIKREDNEDLQILAAKNLAHLVDYCTERNPSPNTKITTNLCTFLCSDMEFTPRLTEQTNDDCFDGILTLYNRQRNAERVTYNRGAGCGLGGVRGPGRPPATDLPLEELLACEEPEAKASRTRRRGATLALDAIAKLMGPRLPERLPHLWKLMILNNQDNDDAPISDTSSTSPEKIREEVNNLVCGLQVLEVVGPSLHQSLMSSAMNCLPKLCKLLTNPYKVVRHMTARCISTMANLDSEITMEHVVRTIIPLLETRMTNDADRRTNAGPNDYDNRRQGAAEALTCIVENLGVRVVPYAVLFMIPLLGRMSDQNPAVRLACSGTLATLVQLLPLDAGTITDQPHLVKKKAQERHFLEQLLNPRNIPDTKLIVDVAAELRSYQQQGLNWLDFLNRYNLHGILCDDMGLGKTIQTLCILAVDHHRNPESPPSLVICPHTLTGHWAYETEKFISTKDLSVIQYVGNRSEREKLQPRVRNYRLVVASYEIMRKEIEFFQSVQWNYCVLDEGHIIKNGKTKSAQAAKKLRAHHRLILSGTPVQNHVLELWSLFDFLMPGFLGSEKQFSAKYSKPILACRESKAGPKDQEAGALAMEALRRQVLPFILRRNKEDVLKDLPPKITQDYYCDLSPIQRILYEDYRSRRTTSVIQTTEPSSPTNKSPTSNVFMALRYLRNVCNHPKLVLHPRHPQYQAVCAQLKQHQTSLTDIEIAAKLPALKQLLLDCGIGQPQPSSYRISKNSGTIVGSSSQNDGQQTVPTQELVGQHRALIFCQLRAMLDVVEKDLLAVHLPSVTYLRLDGSVPSAQQTAIVARFNSDPSIDVLLLTTQVGGLGLNLTGADTVIFVEHDWNPMKDLQAMDRAHRIGQKKVVNVYRLITRCTVEEKIMSLQKFKLHTANTVITAENSSLATMVNDQLLDLFSLDNKKDVKPNETDGSRTSSSIPGVSKTVLDLLPELWEQQQYDDEYDLDSFVTTLKSCE